MTIRSRLKKHSLKFLSLFLSVFLWAYVLNSEKMTFEKSVSLDYILPDDMVFAQKPPQEVIFQIHGPRAFMKAISEREDRLVIDLNRVNSKRQLFLQADVNPAQLSLPLGMVVQRVLPRKIPIRLEHKSSKIVPIKLELSGHLPDKVLLSKTQVIPPEIEIYGPRSLIHELKFISTRPVDVESLIGQEFTTLDLALPDERFSLSSDTKVNLKYEIKIDSSPVTLAHVPIKFLSKNNSFESKIKEVTLKLLVPEGILKNRSNISSSVQVWADVPDKGKGRAEIPLKVVLPPSVQLQEISPKSIIVNML